MTSSEQPTATQPWTSVQAYTLAVICLLLGVAGGWLIRASGPSSPAAPPASVSAPEATGSASQEVTPAELKKVADAQVQPLLEKLKNNPNDLELLANIGNVYYDGQLYPNAIEFYQRALKLQPNNTNIRTDMATAYWYSGNADEAIKEFQKSLSYEPNKPNTLFNLGMVQWQGKMDVAAAVATWQKLLDTNPNFEGRTKVEEMIAQAKKHSTVDMQRRAK
jgi:cytochrome c-type biogenesis protein CcmH/NrfG